VGGAVLSDPAATGWSKTSVVCSATPGQCAVAPSIAALQSGTFPLPPLASGDFYELDVSATVTATSGIVSNAASVSAPAGTLDPDSSNDNVSDSEPVLLGNLTILPLTLDLRSTIPRVNDDFCPMRPNELSNNQVASTDSRPRPIGPAPPTTHYKALHSPGGTRTALFRSIALYTYCRRLASPGTRR